MTEPALEARGLTKSFGDVVAVAGVDLTLERGQCLALLGPNGAGKTTTVEILEGLSEADQGSVRILGRTYARDRRGILERIGVLLQETNLYKRYTVRETLKLFASFYPKTRDIDQLMQRLLLADKADTRLMHLSGGQKQRVYIGCALINSPELLFLDEPTTGLDPQARRMIWDLVREIKAEGTAILLTTHYMEEAEILADRVAIIDHGKIIAEGPPQELIRRVFGEQVLQVSAEGHAEDTRAKLVAQLPWFAEAVPVVGDETQGSWEIASADALARTALIAQAADKAGIKLTSLEVRRGTLEDVFLKLTGRSIRDA